MEKPEVARKPGDVVVTPEPAALRLTTYPPKVEVSSSLWNNWSRIAIEHEAEAWRHRADWQEGRLRNILPEFHASLISVTAVAFSFEALHGTLAPLLGRDPRQYQNRWAYVRDSFNMACKPSRKWQNEFEWLFRVARPSAIHFVPRQHEPIYHEGLNTAIAQENHLFCAESTTRAVDLMMEVFRALLAPGLKRSSAIEDWSLRAAHVLVELAGLRGDSR